MRIAPIIFLVLPFIANAHCVRAVAVGRVQKIFSGNYPVWRLSFSGDGKTLLVGQRAKPYEFFRLRALDAMSSFTTKWVHDYSHYHRYGEEVDFLNLPQFFAANTHILVNSKHTRTLDAGSGALLRDYGELGSSAISPTGQWVAHEWERQSDKRSAPSADKTLFFLQSTDGKQWQQKRNITRPDNNTFTSAFAFSPDGKTLAVGISKSVDEKSKSQATTRLEFYNVKTGRRFRICPDYKLPKSVKSGAVAGQAQWSRNGRYILTSWIVYYEIIADYTKPPPTIITLWRASDGKRLASRWLQSTGPWTLEPWTDFNSDAFELQNDGRVLAVSASTASVNNDGNVYLDKVSSLSLKSPQPLVFHFKITAATMSPDGAYLVVGTSGGEVYRKRLK